MTDALGAVTEAQTTATVLPAADGADLALRNFTARLDQLYAVLPCRWPCSRAARSLALEQSLVALRAWLRMVRGGLRSCCRRFLCAAFLVVVFTLARVLLLGQARVGGGAGRHRDAAAAEQRLHHRPQQRGRQGCVRSASSRAPLPQLPLTPPPSPLVCGAAVSDADSLALRTNVLDLLTRHLFEVRRHRRLVRSHLRVGSRCSLKWVRMLNDQVSEETALTSLLGLTAVATEFDECAIPFLLRTMRSQSL